MKKKIILISIICILLFIIFSGCTNEDKGKIIFDTKNGDKFVYVYKIPLNSAGESSSVNLFYCRQIKILDKNDEDVTASFSLFSDNKGIFVTKLVEFNDYFIVMGYSDEGDKPELIDHSGYNKHHVDSTYPDYEIIRKHIKFQKEEYKYKEVKED